MIALLDAVFMDTTATVEVRMITRMGNSEGLGRHEDCTVHSNGGERNESGAGKFD